MAGTGIKALIKKFEEKAPEIVFEWKDAKTDAEGWVVINSLRGGAAGGGTRMRKGLDRHEVLSLAKTMEIKFAVAGPPIGGAKSGINFDPNDPRKAEVLDRWYKAVMPLLKTYYGTGGDLNVDEVKDVIPVTEKYGLQHPQEGVLMGHFSPDEEEKSKRIYQLQHGVTNVITDEHYSPDVNRSYTVADMITGWGVSEAVRHFYRLWRNQDLKGKKAIVQGWGNVGAAAAYYLAQNGAKIVGIIDRAGGLIKEEGFTFEEIRDLFNGKDKNALRADSLLSFDEVNSRIWDVEADIFIPAAASRLVSKEQLERLHRKGVKVISCGANVPFNDKDIFYGPTSEYADDRFAMIADFVANCGAARNFAYLMQANADLSNDAIFSDVSETIGNALEKIYANHQEETNLAEAAYDMVLHQLLDV